MSSEMTRAITQITNPVPTLEKSMCVDGAALAKGWGSLQSKHERFYNSDPGKRECEWDWEM